MRSFMLTLPSRSPLMRTSFASLASLALVTTSFALGGCAADAEPTSSGSGNSNVALEEPVPSAPVDRMAQLQNPPERVPVGLGASDKLALLPGVFPSKSVATPVLPPHGAAELPQPIQPELP
jgi:hypothetical protein